MSLPALSLDFVTTNSSRRSVGAVIALIGAVVCALALWQWQRASGEVEGLRLRMEERSGAQVRAPSRAATPQVTAAATAAAAQLATAWPALLADLEAAAQEDGDDIALLAVEPDRGAGKVKLTAEARSLMAALTYLKRLQARPVVRHALLDSHELQDKSPQRPVRVQITADWSQG